MREGHADLDAAVLEAEHLRDTGSRHQVGGAMAPGVHDEACVRMAEVGERPKVVAGEADHLATAGASRCTGETGKAVLEHDDVVVGSGNLSRQAGRVWAQRAVGGIRHVGAVLTLRRDRDPLTGLPVEAQLRLTGVTFGSDRRSATGAGV